MSVRILSEGCVRLVFFKIGCQVQDGESLVSKCNFYLPSLGMFLCFCTARQQNLKFHPIFPFKSFLREKVLLEKEN